MVCRLLRIFSGVTVLTLAGCQAYGPYNYGGGAYSYPGTPTDGAYMMPQNGNPYVNSPYMGSPGISPTPIYNGSPGVFPGSTTPYSSSPPPIPRTGGTIPRNSPGSPFGSTTPPATTENTSGGTRPQLPPDSDEYPEPPPQKSTQADPPSISEPSGPDEADFKSERSGKQEKPQSKAEEWLKDVEQNGGDSIPNNSSQVDPNLKRSSLTDNDTDEFSSPSAFDAGNGVRSADDSAWEKSPYAYDEENKTWFRGTAEFDDEMQTWMIRYLKDADKDGGAHGRITLAEHAKLSSLRRGDIVLVYGTFDPAQLDRNDQPTFVIKTLKKLILEDSSP